MYKWTAIYLVNCEDDFPQLAAAQDMFDQLFGCRMSTDAAVVFCLTMPVTLIKRLDPGFVPKLPLKPEETTTVFYRLAPLSPAINGKNSELKKLAPEDQDFDPSEKEDVARYFKMIVTANLMAERHLLITWGHGSGSGVFFTGAFPRPGQRLKILRMDDLGFIIEKGFGENSGRKIDAVIMMNCFMQYFDTLYALRAAKVDYLMTSQFGLDFVGYNYSAIFGALFADAGIGAGDLVKLAVRSLKDAVMIAQLEHGAFFASDLAVCDRLTPALSTLGARLLAALSLDASSLIGLLPMDKYLHSGYRLADLFVFTELVRQKFGEAWEADTKRILKLKGALLIETYIGRLQNRPDFTLGCSFCLPTRGDNKFFKTFVEPGEPHASLFSNLAANQWPAFLRSYTALLPVGPIQTKRP
jgi:hypothetical protein